MGFIFSWPIAIVGLIVTPLLALSMKITAGHDAEMNFEGTHKDDLDSADKKKDENARSADIHVSDAIINYKTVASFGNDNIVI